MMRPPAINLARRPFRNNTAYYAVYSACLALLLTATAWNAWRFFAGSAELTRLREDVSFATGRYMKLHDEVEEMKKQISTLDLSVINAKSSFAEGLILSRFFSWSLLFDRLEDLIPPEVKIQRIAPAITTKRIEVSLSGMARTPGAFLEFEGNLASSDWFSNVYPVREDQQEGQPDLKFTLVMDYIPAGKTPPAPVEQTAALPSGTEAGDATAGSGGQPAAGTEASALPSADGSAAASPPGETPAAPAAPADATGPPGALPAASAGSAAAPVPSAVPPGAAADQAAGAPGAASPPPDVDPNLMSRQEFIQRFGLEEWMYTRGKYKGKARPSKTGSADPNGATP